MKEVLAYLKSLGLNESQIDALWYAAYDAGVDIILKNGSIKIDYAGEIIAEGIIKSIDYLSESLEDNRHWIIDERPEDEPEEEFLELLTRHDACTKEIKYLQSEILSKLKKGWNS